VGSGVKVLADSKLSKASCMNMTTSMNIRTEGLFRPEMLKKNKMRARRIGRDKMK
jgi:hypothetical protein